MTDKHYSSATYEQQVFNAHREAQISRMSSSAIAEDHVLVGGRITAGSGFTNLPISSAGKDSAEGMDATRKTAKTATKDGKGTKRRQTDPSSKDTKDAKEVRGDAPPTAAEK